MYTVSNRRHRNEQATAGKELRPAWRPFEEARAFARGLGLRNQKEWIAWAKSNARPHDIPRNPYVVYSEQGWISLSDWLGSKHKKGSWRTFGDAQNFARHLKLRTQEEWQKWAHSNQRPDDIPAYPQGAYKSKGWTNWGDWLGTKNRKGNYRPFEQARNFVRSLALKNQSEWRAWAKTDARPADIPASPVRVYKPHGWVSWGDWLGTEFIAPQVRKFLPFEEARAFVHGLAIKDKNEWVDWTKSGRRPENIPAGPSRFYSRAGWSGWGDWLGTKRIANQQRVFRSFEEARAYVRSLGLRNYADWREWAKGKGRPTDIPSDAYGVYEGHSWAGWSDWLGSFSLWNRNSVINFLHSLEPILYHLRPNELYAIMRQNGMVASIGCGKKNASLIKSIRDICSSPDPRATYDELISQIERQDAGPINEEVENVTAAISAIVTTASDAKDELPQLRSLAALKAVDMLVEAGITADEETIEFLVANRVSGLWQEALNEPTPVLDYLLRESGGTYFTTIKDRFERQYYGAVNLPIPSGYSFAINGIIAPPNLMQKLTAYRVLTERRLGNWSGVGAGKTISAVLTSRVIGASLTVVVAFNSTLEAWARVIRTVFPDSIVHVKERGAIKVNRGQHTYLILNFETFQQPYASEMVRQLVAQHQTDFIVLDEIQNVKQRSPNPSQESLRRKVVNGLLSAASEKNPDLCVLGMSATPVINNLYEAKALLEMVKGVHFDDLKTFSSIANASAMHEKLILYGIRYRPHYSQTIETVYPQIDGEAFLPELQKAKGILATERVLLEAKQSTILGALRKGTLVYCHYVSNLTAPLRKAIERAGFRVGLYTGEDKSGLEPFKQGKVDILIGSVPVGTGVDGLQYVCNRLVIVSLPWTSAEYEQLVGRLYRQGSQYKTVEVVIPQVVLSRAEQNWSWDQMRMNRILYKRTLADAALDGVIPEGELSSPEMLQKMAHEALLSWITRVEQDGPTTIDRALLRVPLPESVTRVMRRRFGDLSLMNNRINVAYSHTTHERLTQHPEEWYHYHTLYREARQSWPEIPFQKIAESLKKRPDWVIGDFGCGEALLAQLLPNTVRSFDHVAISERVTACDMAHTPLADESLDVAVFSLALMGLNYAEYLAEAYRALKFGGMLKIAETIERWKDKRGVLLKQIAGAGFTLIGNVEESNQFFYVSALKT
jgi:superfamily II DNA or RNA helicase